MTAADLFSLTPGPVLPDATVEALSEIACAEKRAWITTILVSAVARNTPLDMLQRVLVGERLDHDYIARIVDTIQEGRK